jgi:hypothetical protein
MSSLTVMLALPPSANALNKNNPQGGRSKTRAYSAWLEDARYRITTAWRALGCPTFAKPLRVTLSLGLIGRVRDAGNCLKPIEDALVKFVTGLPDDRWNDEIAIRRDATVPAGAALVTIESIAPG